MSSLFFLLIVAVANAPTVVYSQWPFGSLCGRDNQCGINALCHGSKDHGLWTEYGVCGCRPGFVPVKLYLGRDNFNDDRSCDYCPRGKIPNPEQYYCSTCEYPNRPLYSKGCLDCPAGSSSNFGDWSCSKCPVNTYSPSPASLCLGCPVGKYSDAGETSCTKTCPSSTQVANADGVQGCCSRYASLFNNGTLAGASLPSTTFTVSGPGGSAPSTIYVPSTYPSTFVSKSQIYIANHNQYDQNYRFFSFVGGPTFLTSQDFNRAYIVSPNFRYFVMFQADGNICKYRGAGPSCNQGPVWCSSPPTNPGRYLHIMQEDGNLCTAHVNQYGDPVSGLWCMMGQIVPGAYMEIDDYGNFCRKKPNGDIINCV